MKDFLSLILSNKYFIYPSLAMWGLGIIVLVGCDKGSIILALSGMHNPYMMTFWQCVTYMGGAVFYVFALMIGLFFNRQYVKYAAIQGLILIILIRLLKMIASTVRPYEYFTSIGLWDDISTYVFFPMESSGSFPSGHTMTAYALMSMTAFYCKRGWIKFLLFLMATMVAFSRLYTLQHFFVDVYAGSIIGVFLSLVIKYIGIKFFK